MVSNSHALTNLLHSVIPAVFETSKLKLWQILGITYVWSSQCGRSRGMGYKQVMHELEIGSRKTLTDWNQFCRDVCVQYFQNNPEQIGGPGQTVEIDESLFARRKYNNGPGQAVPEQWVFGGYDPNTKKGFLVYQ